MMCNVVSAKLGGVDGLIKSVLTLFVVIVVVIHVLLTTFELISLPCGLSGLAIQVVYIQFLKNFPSVQARYKLFWFACGVILWKLH